MINNDTLERHLNILVWAKSFLEFKNEVVFKKTIKEILECHKKNLKNYFALCGLARHKTAYRKYRDEANDFIFAVRVKLEKSIIDSLLYSYSENEIIFEELFGGSFFGQSKKQGISHRMPLSSCKATRLCSSACYAHDAMDAMPNSVVRGAINGTIAYLYENENDAIKAKIAKNLEKPIKSAVNFALKEVSALKNGWSRKPFIRFSHVGELAAFPCFANMIAEQVDMVSGGSVQCVIYTRHHKSVELDPALWVINYTLDPSSPNKDKIIIPDNARVVFSAFGGKVSKDAEINFLEHHPWFHAKPSGSGQICPATLPSAKLRTCDGVKCDRCFVQKV